MAASTIRRAYDARHYAVVGLDLESYSKRSDREQVAVQDALREMLNEAMADAFPKRSGHVTLDTGDGAFVCLPDEYDKTLLVTRFDPAVNRFLLRYNHDKTADAQMRVRMVFHIGNVSIHGQGRQRRFAGTAVNHASRLLNAGFLRRALKNASPRRAVVLALSQPFYQDIVVGHLGEYGDDFKRHKAQVKNTHVVGWVLTEPPEIKEQPPPRPPRRSRRGASRNSSGSKRGVPPQEAQRTYPFLYNDVIQAGTILLPGRGGKGKYEFRLYSVGERGSALDPDLYLEVEDGLLEKIRGFDKAYDYILAVEQAGVRWALLVARQLNRPLKIITLQRSDPDPGAQIRERQQKGGFYKQRDLYFPRMPSGKKVLVVDDVISSGDTIRAILRGLKKCNVEPVGIFCIIDKTGASQQIEAEEGIPVRSLITIG